MQHATDTHNYKEKIHQLLPTTSDTITILANNIRTNKIENKKVIVVNY